MSVQIGIIGGSGLYDMAELTDREEVRLSTPFGDPSGPYVIATLRGHRVAFLARHGAGHRIPPSELNFRANIFGFKLLGRRADLLGERRRAASRRSIRRWTWWCPTSSSTAPRGASAPSFRPGHRRARVVRAPGLSRTEPDRVRVGRRRWVPSAHMGGTYVCMEGPQFSTLAESRLYKSWGMDVIGMTNLQEAKLAREAEICYTTIALVTDYDCWHPEHDQVTVDMIVANLQTERRDGPAAHRGGRRDVCRPSRTCACAQRAGDGDHHQPRRHPGGDQAGSCPDHRQVRQVRSSDAGDIMNPSWPSARWPSTRSRTRSARRSAWWAARPPTSRWPRRSSPT